MKQTTPNLNDPKAVLEYCDPALRVLRDALNHGVQVADSIVDEWFSETFWDPCFWPYAVRRGVHTYISGLDPSDNWQLDQGLALSGIEMWCGDLVVRVWKRRSGGPPPPGSSHARKAFCRQLTLDLDGVGGTNFIADWDVNEQREVELFVSRPVGSWEYWEKAMLEWRCPVRFPDDGALAFPGTTQMDVLTEHVIDPRDLKAAGDKP